MALPFPPHGWRSISLRRYLLRRIAQVIPLLLIVTFISYGIMLVAPGGPEQVLLGGEDPTLDPNQIAALRARWGLDDPIPVQYARWLGNVLRGDLGRSYYFRKPVAEAILERFPNTLQLGLVVVALTYLLALPLGVITAVRQYSLADYAASTFSFLGHSMPSFWIGLMLIFLVALPSGGLIPTSGFSTPDVTLAGSGFWAVLSDRARFMFLPAVTLVVGGLAGLSRYTRNSMLEVLREDYVRTARAKGLSERVVIFKHALRNALLPVVTLSSNLLVFLFSGSVVVEQVFAWPGLGTLAIQAVSNRDYPVVMAFLLVGAVLSTAGHLMVDVLYVFVDPRIKYV